MTPCGEEHKSLKGRWMRSFRLFASEKERAAEPIGRGGQENALPGKDWKKKMERGEKERPAGPE